MERVVSIFQDDDKVAELLRHPNVSVSSSGSWLDAEGTPKGGES